jgi:2-oxoisovalerate dehydrogenase E2 component (dihydrolipoyl transacylase)
VAKVTMPQLGESVAEGTIGKWLKKPGDTVAKYEPLLEVITDKVNAEVPSPFAGVLKEILVEEGATVPNNAEIAIIEAADGDGAATVATEKEAAPAKADGDGAAPVATEKEAAPAEAESGARVEAKQPAAGGEAPAPASESTPESAQGPAGSDERPVEETGRAAQAAEARPAATATTPAPGPAHAGDGNARMTPAVRRLLREHNLEAAMIVGTGGGGRITREDVINFVEAQRTGQAVGAQAAPAVAGSAPAPAPAQAAPAQAAPSQASPSQPAAPAAAPGPSAPPAAAPAPSFAPGEEEQLIPWTQMRKGVAKAMVHAKTTVPHAYTTVEVDMTNLVRVRDTHKKEYQAREGINLSFVPFIVKAVVETLKKHPRINAYWSEEGLLVKRRVNIGIAVAVEDGLIVPVVHDADQLSISGLNRAVLDVANRARANKLRLDDLQGGTITVNNTGWFGSVVSQSIVNTPQVAIVNMEAIVKRPVVRETPDGDIIAVRSIMNLPVAFDHRATDGAQVGRFVADLKAWLEAVGPDLPIY